MAEAKARRVERRRPHALTREEELATHLPEDETHGQRRQGDERRAPEDAAEDTRELSIVDGARGDGVHRSVEPIVEQRGPDDAEDVVERDPAHPLPAAPYGPAGAEEERREHPRERSAGCAEHDPEPGSHA